MVAILRQNWEPLWILFLIMLVIATLIGLVVVMATPGVAESYRVTCYSSGQVVYDDILHYEWQFVLLDHFGSSWHDASGTRVKVPGGCMWRGGEEMSSREPIDPSELPWDGPTRDTHKFSELYKDRPDCKNCGHVGGVHHMVTGKCLHRDGCGCPGYEKGNNGENIPERIREG